MQITVAKDSSHLAEMAAQFLIQQITRTSDSRFHGNDKSRVTIGLATGSTPKKTYAELAKKIREEKNSVKHLHCFHLDEYADMPPSDPRSFAAYIRQHVMNPLKLDESQISLWQENPADYEIKLRECGGIDCQILGLGINGHIGFNEPGSLRNSRCRVVELTQETLEHNRADLEGGKLPTQALTMGIDNIMESKNILLLVSGKNKQESFARFMNEQPNSNYPASFLKEHSRLKVMVDQEACDPSLALKVTT